MAAIGEHQAGAGRLDAATLRALARSAPLDALAARARALRDDGHGDRVSYSRKVFVPLTRLCRDVCRYCTFARPPRRGERAFLTPDEVLDIVRAGERAGCKEALFTLGDKPELRYSAARDELRALGHDTTLSYLAAVCERVLRETSLLPHVNPGVMTGAEIAALRRVSVSQGIMLESASERLCAPGGPHHGSPDKAPAVRLATLRAAGELAVPFTTGILIGIGETRDERVDALLAIRDLHETYGHIQEVIVQNFRAKPRTPMQGAPEPDRDELAWTVAVARLALGSAMNLQVPPNLTEDFGALVAAGLNDWGGVSPVTPDHVNPEAPWPQLARLEAETARAGKILVERLAVYPAYATAPERWIDPGLAPRLRRAIDGQGYARECDWAPGMQLALPAMPPRGAGPSGARPSAEIAAILDAAVAGDALTEDAIVRLFQARGADFDAVREAADRLRAETVGDTVRYVVNRNINYTNVCAFHCKFCAFSKGRAHEHLRGNPYDLDLDEVGRRVREAWDRGATEVCMQGGIHPDYHGETYLTLCRAAKRAAPGIHVHAFSPLEVVHGATTLGLPVAEFLRRLHDAGLGTLPGTAAEVLDDEVRAILCPDKLDTQAWLDVVGTAHDVGFRTTATIMFGHVDGYAHWARHLIRVRALQSRTGGFTEFVPLPFVHMEAPLYAKGLARRGPTPRETVLMHAIARLALHPLIPHIQVSWVKLGPEGVRACLAAGADDLGGTLMNESISRAAGTTHGQELPPAAMDRLIESCGRVPQQRTTLYVPVPAERRDRSYQAAPLAAPVQTPIRRRARAAGAPDAARLPATS
jgi:FO synthase